MKVDREVIIDLLPVYFSGEASAATQALVEGCFREDPELERIARSANRSVELLKVAPGSAHDWEEKLALERARWEEQRALEKARDRAEAEWVIAIVTFLCFVITVVSQLRNGTLHWLGWNTLGLTAVACVLVYVFWRARRSFALLPKSFHLKMSAFFFTATLLGFVHVQPNKITWFFLTDWPVAGVVMATITAGLWIAFFMQRSRELRQPPESARL
jgi:cation transport ATPase